MKHIDIALWIGRFFLQLSIEFVFWSTVLEYCPGVLSLLNFVLFSKIKMIRPLDQQVRVCWDRKCPTRFGRKLLTLKCTRARKRLFSWGKCPPYWARPSGCSRPPSSKYPSPVSSHHRFVHEKNIWDEHWVVLACFFVSFVYLVGTHAIVGATMGFSFVKHGPYGIRWLRIVRYDHFNQSINQSIWHQPSFYVHSINSDCPSSPVTIARDAVLGTTNTYLTHKMFNVQ